jgi:hypothetical protein
MLNLFCRYRCRFPLLLPLSLPTANCQLPTANCQPFVFTLLRM